MRAVPTDALMTEHELAAYLQVSLRTVRRWRAAGKGPPVLWAGDRPRYRREDVDAWLEAAGPRNGDAAGEQSLPIWQSPNRQTDRSPWYVRRDRQ